MEVVRIYGRKRFLVDSLVGAFVGGSVNVVEFFMVGIPANARHVVFFLCLVSECATHRESTRIGRIATATICFGHDGEAEHGRISTTSSSNSSRETDHRQIWLWLGCRRRFVNMIQTPCRFRSMLKQSTGRQSTKLGMRSCLPVGTYGIAPTVAWVEHRDNLPPMSLGRTGFFFYIFIFIKWIAPTCGRGRAKYAPTHPWLRLLRVFWTWFARSFRPIHNTHPRAAYVASIPTD